MTPIEVARAGTGGGYTALSYLFARMAVFSRCSAMAPTAFA